MVITDFVSVYSFVLAFSQSFLAFEEAANEIRAIALEIYLVILYMANIHQPVAVLIILLKLSPWFIVTIF